MRYREKLSALNNALAEKKQEYAAAILASNVDNTLLYSDKFICDIYVLEGRIQQVKEFILEDFERESINESIDRLTAELPDIFGV